MTLSQLEYIVAVADIGHFGQAAEQLGVTQPTLSMMIKKLEEELGVILFNRNAKPIKPSQIGALVVQQAKRVLNESGRIEHIIDDFTDNISGSYSLGLIPTIAPYLVPGIVQLVQQNTPEIQLHLFEAQTEQLIEDLSNGKIDAAILATPINNEDLVEVPLFYEEFLVFGDATLSGEYVLPEQIDPNKLWLLEKGHCLRAQIINLCELKNIDNDRIFYNSGSLETLIEVVRQNDGLTILPELTAKKLSQEDKVNLRRFMQPAPYREMSLVYHKYSAKHKFLESVQDMVEDIVPLSMRKLKSNSRVIEIY